MHCTYITIATEAMTTAHVEVFRVDYQYVCVNQVAVKLRVQISSDDLLLKYLSSNRKPYNFWSPQDVLLLESVNLK